MTAAFATNPTTSTSALTLTASCAAAVASSTITVTGTSGSLTASISIALNIVGLPLEGFLISPSASALSIARGRSGIDTITVTQANVCESTGNVTLSASGLPAGITAAFGTNPAASTSVLTLTASSTATVGPATVTITGTASGLISTTTIALTVLPVGVVPACKIVYTITPQNSSAFGAAITIDNTGTTAWTSWMLSWSFANGQTVAELWNGIETRSGTNVTVTNESYNGSIAAGASYTGVGFNATWNGTTNAVPTGFSVNGTACTVNQEARATHNCRKNTAQQDS